MLINFLSLLLFSIALFSRPLCKIHLTFRFELAIDIVIDGRVIANGSEIKIKSDTEFMKKGKINNL